MIKRFILSTICLLIAATSYADTAKQVDFLLSGYRHPTTDEVLTGAKVWTFLDNTSTMSALYTDKDQGGTATNPIILDSSGKAEVYGSTIYKFVIYDSNDVLIETINGLEYRALTELAPVDSISALRAITYTPEDGQVVEISGYYTTGDGGGQSVYWESTSTETDNGFTVFKVTLIATGRFKSVNTDILNVKHAGARGDGTAANYTTNTTAIQTVLDTTKRVKFPLGTFIVDDELVIKPYHHISGEGIASYVAALDDDIGDSTRIIQTVAKPIFTTDFSDPPAQSQSYIVIRDLVLLGGIVSAPIGTEGVYCASASGMKLYNVRAHFFTGSGFRFAGSLLPTVKDCYLSYNQYAGIWFEYDIYVSSNANAYQANIENCRILQSGDYGILVGLSSVEINISGTDIESGGSFYPTKLGIGLYIEQSSRTVTINGCWFEGNKIHAVVGNIAAPSRNTIPENTVIRDTEFWSVTDASNIIIQLNAGRDTILDSCEFFEAGSIIELGVLSDNPKITNCSGTYKVVDSNDNNLTVDSKASTNNYANSALATTGWTLANCTLDVEYIKSPAGAVPVYKITPLAIGQVQISSPAVDLTYLDKRHTIGWYQKTDSSIQHRMYFGLNGATSYTSATKDVFDLTDTWTYANIGRHIPASDTGTQTLLFRVEAEDTSPIYISALVLMPDIVYDPYKIGAGGVDDLLNQSTPSVYGLKNVVTTGVTSISNFDDGAIGQKITVLADHSLIIVYNATKIKLAGSVDFGMTAGDTLSLILKSDGIWYETARSVL